MMSCTEETIMQEPEVSNEIKEIQESLVGEWNTFQYSVILLQDIAEGNEIIIYPYDDPNICEVFEETLPEKDFIDAYEVTVEDDVLRVTKFHRCSSKAEALTWEIEKATGEDFDEYFILEKNESNEVVTIYKKMYSSAGTLVLEAVYKNDHPPYTVVKYRVELDK